MSRPPTLNLVLAPVTAVWIAAAIFGSFFLVALAQNIPNTLTRASLGFVLALALDPIVVRLRARFGISRGSAVAVVSLGAIALFVLLIVFVGPAAVRQAEQFGAEAPETLERLSQLPVLGGILESLDASDRLRQWINELPSKVDDQAVGNLVEAFVGGLLSAVTVLVIGIAVLADGERLLERGRRLVPARHRRRAMLVGRIFHRTIGAYFAGSILVATLAATFVLSVGLLLGVPLAPVAALWVLAVNLIPQVGGLLGASFFTLLGFAEGPGTGVLCLALYLTYMTIENHLIQPVIVGHAVDLSAPATMLAALAGGAAAGVPGAMIATPLLSTAKALYIEIRNGAFADEDVPPPPPPTRESLLQRIRSKIRRR